jgi:hypothetical protein
MREKIIEIIKNRIDTHEEIIEYHYYLLNGSNNMTDEQIADIEDKIYDRILLKKELEHILGSIYDI